MVGHGVCEGTVVAFATRASKYSIQYTDGTTAMLTKTALTELLPVLADETLAPTAAEPIPAPAVTEATAMAQEPVAVSSNPSLTGDLTLHFRC